MKSRSKYIFIIALMFLCIGICTNRAIVCRAASDQSSILQTVKKDGWDMKNMRYYKNGKYLTGFKKIASRYYYFNKKGKAATGWKSINGKKFYFKKAGGAGVKGSALTGLSKVKGKKYFFSKRGVMQTGWKSINGKKYYFRKAGDTGIKGSALTGMVNIKGKLYYFDLHGVMRKGFITIGNKTYYFSASGAAISGWITYGTYCYYFDPVTKVCAKNTVVDGYKVDAGGRSKTRYTVRRLAYQLTNNTMSNNRKIEVLFDYVTTNSWDYKRTYEHMAPNWVWYKGWTDDFAYDLISTGHGNCYRYSSVFGYLVKEACGYEVCVYCGSAPALRGGTTPHGWTTVKINGKWYYFDPDLYKFGTKSANYYYRELTVSSRYYQPSAVCTELQ